MRALVDALDEATLRTQILLTTHSADMLDNPTIQPHNVRAVRMEKGRTIIGPVDEASVEIVGPWSVREVPLADFFTGYRTTALGAGEVIRSIRVPRRQPTLIGFHKIAKRRLDDISSVAVAFALDLDGDVVRRARIGLGGVAATPVRATATEAALEGGTWGSDLVERAAEVLATEGTPMDDHRASAAYRSAMLGQSLRKLFHQSGQEQPA